MDLYSLLGIYNIFDCQKYNCLVSINNDFCRFSKSSERQYSLRAPDSLSEPIVMVELDTSNGVMFPLYDPDTSLIFLCGKGDSVIRYFEVSNASYVLFIFSNYAV